MDACMEDRYTPFESSAAFPAESNDSAQAESFCPQLDSPTCSTAQHGHPLEPLGGESAIKLEPGQQSLQIDCRVSQDPYRSSLPQDRPYGTQEGAGQLQDHHQHLGNPAPHSPVEQRQEPQSSYEPARLPEYQHSPVRPVSAEKKCSQCGATKTPMWRNDTQGNKTLCNACGVRLQRQLNKQKQQAQTVQAQPTTLIAGKLPRCRTSPAKLSRQELLASASSRESPERGEAAPARAGGGSRSLTLVHGQGMQPHLSVAQPPPKRKGSEAAGRSAAAREERKRACNDRSSDSGGGHPSPDAGSPDVVGPITLMAPDKMATNCFAKLHLPASSGQGGAGGMLMVYNEGCNAIAKCSQPGADGQLAYIPEQQAWVWNGHAHCSMVLHNHDTKLRFEELLRKWRMFRQMGFSQALPMQHMSTSLPLDAGLPSFLQGGGNMFPGRHADADDLRFLEHINHKIRGEAAGATPQTGNPKALNALLTEEVFVRLLAAFEYFLQRPQGFTENNVCQLSVNVDWTPNRPVILAVHRYWVGKLQRQGRKEDWQKATRGAGHPASIPRSFSASPPVGSGRSDMSAMTLEDYALSQQRAASEETSDNTQLHSAFATEGSNRPSLDYSTPINYPMPQMVHDSPGMGSFLPGRQPWVLPSCFPPELAPYAMQQVDDWEADPLDPSTLARIADPNQSMGFETRKSGTLTGPSMEDGSMQTPARGMSLQALESVNMGVLPGNPLPEDGQQMFRFLDAPGLLQQSPGNSPRVRHGMRGVGRHSGVDLSSLRKQLYSGSLNELAQDDNMTHQDLTSNQTDHHAFFFDSNDSMKL